ncbi:MAG: sulfate adenylyltransferase [bacterium]|nr:sulfate adenylyltransferase [bacterium]
MSPSTSPRQSHVHGGLDQPVHRFDLSAASQSGLKSVEVNDVDRATLCRIADGTLSPLTGPMGISDCESVLERKAIERDGLLWAWTIPIVLPLTNEEAAECQPGSTVQLVDTDGEPFGSLTVSSCYDWDKNRFLRVVYGTDRTDHEGARRWLADERTKLVGGNILLVPAVDDRPFASYIMGPSMTRQLIREKGWEQSVAFQARNPLDRSHEYALVHGAEVILRSTGKKTGVVLNPLVSQLNIEDVPAAIRMETYEALVESRILGKDDADVQLWKSKNQDLNDNLALVGLDMRMYFAGPAEAVMHAIYRQNMGFTHFIIGRKHAAAEFDDGTALWGDFDAQQIFENLEGKLGIRTVNVGFAAYFEEIGRVGLVSENQGNTALAITGIKLREHLIAGEIPDARIMRETTANILVDYYKTQAKVAE